MYYDNLIVVYIKNQSGTNANMKFRLMYYTTKVLYWLPVVIRIGSLNIAR